MSQSDSDFYKPFIWVLGALVVFTFFIAIVANMFSPKNDYSTDNLVQQSVKKQIAPVGSSRVVEAAPAAVVAQVAAETVTVEQTSAEETAAEVEDAGDTAAEAPALEEASGETAEPENNTEEGSSEAATAEAAESTEAVTDSSDVAVEAGDEAAEQLAVEAAPAEAVSAISANEVPLKVRAVVATNCAGCHQEGVKGAQRTDDAAAWQALSAKGLDALTASVINGKGEMLPRAETSLNDEEIALAVRYMVTQATGEPVNEAPAEGTAPVPESEPVSGEDSAGVAEESSEKTEEVPKAEEAPTTEEAPKEEASADSAETSSTTVESTETAAVREVDTETVTAAAIPANVQAVADGLCAGCHISGVANAPKIGDKAAWEERLAGGMDALMTSVIAGKGAMPARGGSQLSDAELRLAIEYLAGKE